MDYRVVSTKLTEEEHTKFLEFCNKKGLSPFAAVKLAIEDYMKKSSTEMSNWELKKFIGVIRK